MYSRINELRFNFFEFKESSIILFVIGLLAILVLPIPYWLLDFLILCNLSFALLILLLAFKAEKPIELSTFPSILLVATLFRLALNVAATRLILSGGYAGDVIHSVGDVVVGGNYVLGMIVFLVLIIVQYVVVTNGAQRVAEVAARFTLDSMPGKQMSIDADLNMGAIDQQEASDRRQQVEKEANFYGAMDGASKFVKGDAIAGILIVLIDIIGGLIIGVMQLGMSWGDAARNFTLLTIGDGIVTQIPALVLSVATGLLVTRAASDSNLSQTIFKQLASASHSLIIIIAFLFVLLFIPGIPMLPVITLICFVGYALYKLPDASIETSESKKEVPGSKTLPSIEIEYGEQLDTFVVENKTKFFATIEQFREKTKLETGLLLPDVEFVGQNEVTKKYSIKIKGAVYSLGNIQADKKMIIAPQKYKGSGEKTTEPAYGLEALWLSDEEQGAAKLAGENVIDPANIFLTHLIETLKNNLQDLVDRSITKEYLANYKAIDSELIDELVPNMLSLSKLQGILKQLVAQKISLARPDLIFEALIDVAKDNQEVEQIVDQIRQTCSNLVVSKYLDGRDLSIVTVDSRLENQLLTTYRNTGAIEPGIFQKLIRKLDTKLSDHVDAKVSLVVNDELRKPLAKSIHGFGLNCGVFGLSEIPGNVQIKSLGKVEV